MNRSKACTYVVVRRAGFDTIGYMSEEFVDLDEAVALATDLASGLDNVYYVVTIEAEVSAPSPRAEVRWRS